MADDDDEQIEAVIVVPVHPMLGKCARCGQWCYPIGIIRAEVGIEYVCVLCHTRSAVTAWPQRWVEP